MSPPNWSDLPPVALLRQWRCSTYLHTCNMLWPQSQRQRDDPGGNGFYSYLILASLGSCCHVLVNICRLCCCIAWPHLPVQRGCWQPDRYRSHGASFGRHHTQSVTLTPALAKSIPPTHTNKRHTWTYTGLLYRDGNYDEYNLRQNRGKEEIRMENELALKETRGGIILVPSLFFVCCSLFIVRPSWIQYGFVSGFAHRWRRLEPKVDSFNENSQNFLFYSACKIKPVNNHQLERTRSIVKLTIVPNTHTPWVSLKHLMQKQTAQESRGLFTESRL